MEFNKAVGLAKGLAKSYRAVLEVVDALEGVDNLEQTRKELEREIDKNRPILVGILDELSDAQAKLDDTRVSISDARVEAKNIITVAKMEAQDIQKEAVKKTSEYTDKVQKEVEDFRANIEHDRKRHADRMAAWAKEEEQVSFELNELRSELSNIKSKFKI